MRGMTELPRCCPSLTSHWPLPVALPQARLVSAHFDEALLQAEDFARCGLVAPAGLERAVAKRRMEYLAGRLCAREAVQQLTGHHQAPGKGEDGAPRWPSGVVGSITHSKHWAAAVVGDARCWRSLGLDAETLPSAARAERLAGEILTADELERLGPDDRALQITLTFSLKESLFKALYPLVNRRFYFADAELLAWEAAGTARLCLLTDLATDWPAGSELSGQFVILDNHLLSLVSVAA